MVLVDMLLSIRSGKAGSDRGLKKRSVEEKIGDIEQGVLACFQ